MDELIQQGHYARKQIGCASSLIAWSHRRRFLTGVALARELAGKRVVDYGCGDGTFLAMLMAAEWRPAHGTGVEIDERLVTLTRERFKNVPDLDFIHGSELERPAHQGAYEGVVCMEVLEHVVDQEAMLEFFHKLLVPGGQILVSVPVETGLPLLIKQMMRRIAGWRGLGDYPGTSGYTARELWASVFAGARQHITRPLHRQADGFASHDHKGFNWMLLRERLKTRFGPVDTLASPLTWLPPHLGSQAWFRARKAK